MLKTTLFALLLAAAGALSGAATAQTYGDRPGCGPTGCAPEGYAYSGNDGGLGRYCPLGYYPHAWPTGTVRCESLDGSWINE